MLVHQRVSCRSRFSSNVGWATGLAFREPWHGSICVGLKFIDAPTCSKLFHTFPIFSHLFPIHPLAIGIKHVVNWWPALRQGEGRDAGRRLRTEGAKSQLWGKIEGVTKFVICRLIALHHFFFTIGYQFKFKATSFILNISNCYSSLYQGVARRFCSATPTIVLEVATDFASYSNGVEVFVESRWRWIDMM